VKILYLTKRKKVWAYLNGCLVKMVIDQVHSIDVRNIMVLCVHIIGSQRIINSVGV
jgi:hypothetical protein